MRVLFPIEVVRRHFPVGDNRTLFFSKNPYPIEKSYLTPMLRKEALRRMGSSDKKRKLILYSILIKAIFVRFISNLTLCRLK